MRELALDAGWLEELPDKLGERELTRQADLGRLVALAAELDDGVLTCAGFAAELRRRFDPGGEGARGVHLLTYHRAKGLEFEAVFLPRLEDKELPSRLARTADELAEERRLLYVGITRAKRRLAVTWSRRPSPFLAELGVAAARAPVAAGAKPPRPPRNESPAAEALRRWRLERARADEVPPYVIFPDRTIDELLARRPASPGRARRRSTGSGPRGSGGSARSCFAVLQQALADGSGAQIDAGAEPTPVRAQVPPSPVTGGARPAGRSASTRRSRRWRREPRRGRRRAGVPRLRQPRPGGDRGREAAHARRAARSAGDRPGQARSLRRRGAGGGRERADRVSAVG